MDAWLTHTSSIIIWIHLWWVFSIIYKFYRYNRSHVSYNTPIITLDLWLILDIWHVTDCSTEHRSYATTVHPIGRIRPIGNLLQVACRVIYHPFFNLVVNHLWYSTLYQPWIFDSCLMGVINHLQILLL